MNKKLIQRCIDVFLSLDVHPINSPIINELKDELEKPEQPLINLRTLFETPTKAELTELYNLVAVLKFDLRRLVENNIEPVGVINHDDNGFFGWIYDSKKNLVIVGDNLYISPPARKPLNVLVEEHPGFEPFIRAFWRRIDMYKNDYGAELPEKLPVEFRANMATALHALDFKYGIAEAMKNG